MNLYLRLADQGERILGYRLRVFTALLIEGATLVVVALCLLALLLLRAWGAPPAAAWPAVALAFVCGVLHVPLALRLIDFFVSDYLRGQMDAMTEEADLVNFSMHAPALYSEAAFARIADEASLRSLALHALCDEVRCEAAACLRSREARAAAEEPDP